MLTACGIVECHYIVLFSGDLNVYNNNDNYSTKIVIIFIIDDDSVINH